ncbi:MAG: type III pantothenate kinase [Pirellulaceae bacterium]|nr:type III pantothenate kinase [Pirellulaceae bacterium]
MTSETICVDIGNSGMRCVRLRPTSLDSAAKPVSTPASTQDAVPWVGDILRVDWPASREDRQAMSPSDLQRLVEPWLGASNHAATRRWLVSSVQREMESKLRGCVEHLGASDYRLVTFRDLHCEIAVDFPHQVGIDRLLAAKAAMVHCPHQPLIVIQAGSAITVDWIEWPDRYCGGAIMPGVPMMLRLLSQAADLLPEVDADELFDLPPLPGKNTTAAMTVGASSAVVGGVQHLVARYREQHGAQTLVVLSGGDGPRLTPHITGPVTVVEQLVLRGLASLARS